MSNTTELLDRFVEDAQRLFGVGPLFARAYGLRWADGRDIYETVEEILASPAPRCDWLSYALGANSRGKSLYDLMRGSIPANARRYLDIGCGYGGCLVAFAKHGLEVHGFDVDAGLLTLARANCADNGLTDCIHEHSIYEEGLPERLGTFDVITCSAVTEHVPDIPKAIDQILSLLNPEGVLLLEIPNLISLHHVATDSHYALFAFSLLSYADSCTYYQTFYPNKIPDVYEAWTIDQYRQLIASRGYNCTSLETTYTKRARFRNVIRLMRRLSWHYRKYLREAEPKFSVDLKKKLRHATGKYVLKAIKEASCFIFYNNDQRLAFRENYLEDAWTLIVRKS